MTSIEKLTDNHNITSFDCGDLDLNEFLSDDAVPFQEKRIANTYVVIIDDKLAAYFSLLNDKISRTDVSKSAWRKLKKLFAHSKHRSNYPAIKIGRFAVSKDFVSQGLGSAIMDAIKQSTKVLTILVALLGLPSFSSCGDNENNEDFPMDKESGKEYKLTECETVGNSVVANDETKAVAFGIIDNKAIMGVFDVATKQRISTIKGNEPICRKVKNNIGYGETEEYDVIGIQGVQLYLFGDEYVCNYILSDNRSNHSPSINHSLVEIKLNGKVNAEFSQYGTLYPWIDKSFVLATGFANREGTYLFIDDTTGEILKLNNQYLKDILISGNETKHGYIIDREHFILQIDHTLKCCALYHDSFEAVDVIDTFTADDRAKEEFAYKKESDGNIAITLTRIAYEDGSKTTYNYILDTQTWKFKE